LRRVFSFIGAYVAAVLAGGAVTGACFSALIDGFVGWNFLSFMTAGAFILSLPFSLVAVAFRRGRPTRLGVAIAVGAFNGLVSSFLLYALAPLIAQAIMMIAGLAGGAVFHAVELRLAGGRASVEA